VPWSLVHAAWVRNHFAVQEGQTACERAFDRSYNGRICAFGEVVLGFVETTKKGAPSWRKGVWLTKSNNNNVHVIAFGEHVVCTRPVRCLPKQWGLKLDGEVSAEPWCFSLASLGNKLISSKTLREFQLPWFSHMRLEMQGPQMKQLLILHLQVVDSFLILLHWMSWHSVRQCQGHRDEGGQADAPEPPRQCVASLLLLLSLLGDDASMAQAPSVPLRADVEHEESDRAAKAPTYDDAR